MRKEMSKEHSDLSRSWRLALSPLAEAEAARHEDEAK